MGPERNTDEFIAQLPGYRRHGVLAGHPLPAVRRARAATPASTPGTPPPSPPAATCAPTTWRASRAPWTRSTRWAWWRSSGYFYFGQDEHILAEAGVRRAVQNATGWLLDAGHTNLLVDVVNECNVPRTSTRS